MAKKKGRNFIDSLKPYNNIFVLFVLFCLCCINEEYL